MLPQAPTHQKKRKEKEKKKNDEINIPPEKNSRLSPKLPKIQ